MTGGEARAPRGRALGDGQNQQGLGRFASLKVPGLSRSWSTPADAPKARPYKADRPYLDARRRLSHTMAAAVAALRDSAPPYFGIVI